MEVLFVAAFISLAILGASVFVFSIRTQWQVAMIMLFLTVFSAWIAIIILQGI